MISRLRKKDFEGGRYANSILQGRSRRKIDSAKPQTRIAVCALGAGDLVISAFFLSLLARLVYSRTLIVNRSGLAHRLRFSNVP